MGDQERLRREAAMLEQGDRMVDALVEFKAAVEGGDLLEDPHARLLREMRAMERSVASWWALVEVLVREMEGGAA